MTQAEVGTSTVDRFLQPLADPEAPCGPDLEYDNAFLELSQAAAGKPETQFGPGEPPDWRGTAEQAEALFERTRDLRVAVLWLRAQVHLHGFAAVPQGLRLLHGLLDAFWDGLHPRPDPDDDDPYARLNALAVLAQGDGLIGDLRTAPLFNVRGLGDLTVRAVEVALERLPAREGEQPLSRGQLASMIGEAVAREPALAGLPAAALERCDALIALIGDKAGAQAAYELGALQALLALLMAQMPVAGEPEAAVEDAASAGPVAGEGGAVGSLRGAVRSRDEALRAIDMVCEYLERTEPTSPAQLLLRRARRLINHNFLQLMKELAPDALAEVARVMGVDPETVQLDDAS